MDRRPFLKGAAAGAAAAVPFTALVARTGTTFDVEWVQIGTPDNPAPGVAG